MGSGMEKPLSKCKMGGVIHKSLQKVNICIHQKALDILTCIKQNIVKFKKIDVKIIHHDVALPETCMPDYYLLGG